MWSQTGTAVVTPAEMAAIDQAAIAGLQTEHGCSHQQALELLIDRAGEATAARARQMLGSCYGKTVLVVAGQGNNGHDGRSAAKRLKLWGAKVVLLDAEASPSQAAACTASLQRSGVDLLLDAAYGTGLSRPYSVPEGMAELARQCSVLAVDIPSGVNGATGEVQGEALPAEATITFGALKPGLLLGAGQQLCGELQLADIGLDASSAQTRLLGPDDLARLLPKRGPQAHKWQAALWLVGGSPGMTGALSLAARAAYRAGAGYVRASIPGQPFQVASPVPADLPLEAVAAELPEDTWAEAIQSELTQTAKFHSLVVGPGLAPTRSAARNLTALLAWFAQQDLAGDKLRTLILDGGALQAWGSQSCLAQAQAHTPRVILTPHDQEFEYLSGQRPGPDRIAAARELAQTSQAVVLLKGATTIVAHPDGRVLLSCAGDERLATAGTGDVLAGVIGALAAQGLEPFLAAGLGAELHGQASQLGAAQGLTAGDLPALVSQAGRVAYETRQLQGSSVCEN